MAEHSTVGAPALSTNIESGRFDEKEAHHVPATKRPIEDEEEDEDMDALIEDLESNDGHGEVSYSPLFLFFSLTRRDSHSNCHPCHPDQSERAKSRDYQLALAAFAQSGIRHGRHRNRLVSDTQC